MSWLSFLKRKRQLPSKLPQPHVEPQLVSRGNTRISQPRPDYRSNKIYMPARAGNNAAAQFRNSRQKRSFFRLPSLLGFLRRNSAHPVAHRPQHQQLPARAVTPIRKRSGALASFGQSTKNISRKLPIKKLGLLVAALVLIALSILVAERTEFWIVKKVDFNSQWQRLASEQEKLRSELIGQNMLKLSAHQIETELQANPYVDQVYVEKRFPNQIFIYLIETEPALLLTTLNQDVLIDTKGKVLIENQRPDKIELTEAERLIYIDPKPFKSEQLRKKWESAEQAKLDEEFNKYWQEQQALLAAANQSGAVEQVTTTSEADAKKEFITNKFSALKPQQLAGVYNQLRTEVKFTVDQRFAREGANEFNVPRQYSLVDFNELSAWQEATSSGGIKQIAEKLTNYQQRWLIVSPATVRIFIKSPGSDSEAFLQFSLRNDITKQLQEFTAVRAELEAKQSTFTGLDLSGEKVVVIH